MATCLCAAANSGRLPRAQRTVARGGEGTYIQVNTVKTGTTAPSDTGRELPLALIFHGG